MVSRGGAPGRSWGYFWGMVAVGMVVAGPVRYLLGGWWYRMRLLLSGAIDPDRTRARQIFALTELIWMAPTILIAMTDTVRFATPADSWASHSTSLFGMTFYVIGLWSVFNSYLAATSAFSLRPRRALFWFAILPGLVVGGVYGFQIYRAYFPAF